MKITTAILATLLSLTIAHGTTISPGTTPTDPTRNCSNLKTPGKPDPCDNGNSASTSGTLSRTNFVNGCYENEHNDTEFKGGVGCKPCGSADSISTKGYNLIRYQRSRRAHEVWDFGLGVASNFDYRATLDLDSENDALIFHFDSPDSTFAQMYVDGKSGDTKDGVFHDQINGRRSQAHLVDAQGDLVTDPAQATNLVYFTATFEKYTFEVKGINGAYTCRLLSFKDRNGYGYDIAYGTHTDTELNNDPALYMRKNSVVDYTRRTFSFDYLPNAIGGTYVISEATLPDGSAMNYEYTDTYLSKAIYPNGEASTYTYSVNAAGETCFNAQETTGKIKEIRMSSSVADMISISGQKLWNQQSMSTNSVVSNGEVFYAAIQGLWGNHRRVYRGEGQLSDNHVHYRNTFYKDFTLTPNSEGRIDRDSVAGTMESSYYDAQWNGNTYGYDHPHRITKKNGTTTYNKYDDLRRKIAVVYADNSYEASQYSSLNLKTVKRDRLGRVTRYTYDDNGNLLTTEKGLLDTNTVLTMTNDVVDMVLVQSADYAIKSNEYYPAGHINQHMLKYEFDYNGNRTEFIYDANQRVLIVNEPNDAGTAYIAKVTMTYDSAGRLATSTDAVGRVTSFNYDKRDRLIKTTFNDNSTELSIYGTGLYADLVVKSKDRNGNVTKTEYDVSARKIKTIKAYSVMNADGSSESINPSSLQSVTDYTYLIGQKKVKTKITDGELTEYFYDYRMRLTETVTYPDAGSSLATKTVYKDNKVFYREDAYGRKTYHSYRAEDAKLVRVVKGTVQSFSLSNFTAVDSLVRDKSNNADYLVTDYELDEAGQRIATIDPRGLRHEIDYDSRGRVTSQVRAVDSLAQTTERIYDANSNIISSIDPVGNVTNMTYGARNKLASRTVATGSAVEATESFTYYADGRAKDHTDFRGNVSTTVWHQCCGRLQANIDQAGNFQVSNNDFYSNVTHTAVVDGATAITDFHDLPDGATVQKITTQFDARHRPIARTLWLQPLGYVDPNNVPIATDPALGLTTRYLYYDEVDGHLELAPLVTELANDGILLGAPHSAAANGSATIVINPEGEAQVSIQDGAGRTVAQGALDKDDFANGTYTLVTWSTTVHDTITNGLLETQQVSALGFINKSRTDGAGRTLEVEDAQGNISTREYDATSNIVKSRDANGVGQDCIFDDLNRDISCTDTVGSTVTKVFDLNNNLLESRDAKNQITSNTFDARNRKESTTDRLGGITNFTYDANSNLIAISDALSKITGYEYDVRNLQTKVTYADGKSTTCDYDTLRRKALCTDQLGEQVDYTYDLAGRMTQRLYKLADNSTESIDSFTYDAASRPLTATKGRYNNTVSYTYDGIGRKATETLQVPNPSGQAGFSLFTTTCAYDADNRETSCTYSNGDVVTKTYTDRNQLSQLNFNAASIADFTYDNGLRESTRTFGNSVVSTKTYNADNTLGSLSSSSAEVSFDYTYDPNKNVSAEASTGLTMDDYSFTALFDAADRVTQWERHNTDSQVWSLDLIGNWSNTTGSLGGNSFNENRTHNDVHELTDIDGQAATYDDKGNLLSISGKTLTWDLDNHLTQVDDLNLGQTTFTYDALGRRVSKDNSITGEVLFVSHGQRVVEEYSNNGTAYELERSYVHGTYIDDLVAHIDAGVTPIVSYYHSDRQFNVRGLTDASGNILELYAYTPYGKRSVIDPVTSDLRPDSLTSYGFTGRYLDTDTGLWYFRARYFSDELGRFISRDPLGFVDGYGLYNGYFAQRFLVDPSGKY
ncbi:MAG: hypothetical protein MK132_22525, partial [Lentisphaerales bacterium]|nr:hypothetical protein [Lentisphaerales bacterium]